jgi:hypothetical protein
MQKVEGSSPFILFNQKARISEFPGLFFCPGVHAVSVSVDVRRARATSWPFVVTRPPGVGMAVREQSGVQQIAQNTERLPTFRAGSWPLRASSDTVDLGRCSSSAASRSDATLSRSRPTISYARSGRAEQPESCRATT